MNYIQLSWECLLSPLIFFYFFDCQCTVKPTGKVCVFCLLLYFLLKKKKSQKTGNLPLYSEAKGSSLLNVVFLRDYYQQP